MSTSLLSNPSGAIELLEAAHSAETDLQRWTLRVLEGATRLFRDNQTIVASTFSLEPNHVELLGHAHHHFVPDGSEMGELLSSVALRARGDRYAAPLTPELKANFESQDPRWTDAFYRHRQHLTFHSQLVKRLPAGVPDVNRSFLEAGGHVDALVLQGVTSARSLALIVPLRTKRALLPRDKLVLTQVALHLESCLRAQLEPDAVAAVIEPSGRIAHAERGAAESGALRSRLTADVLQVEQLRRPSLRSRASSADAWTALIQGRWGLLERVDPDGRRWYLAVDCERAPHQRRLRGLSATEVEVVELASRGLAGKQISYALGLSSGTVSSALRTAALKLGCRNPAALIQLAARLLGEGAQAAATAQLTAAEQGVLALVREGLTNAQIARRRRSSPHTVANQVATVLRKLGLPSRRAASALSLT